MLPLRRVRPALLLLLCFGCAAAGQSVPAGEVLHYRVEWRLIHAGNARLAWTPALAAGAAEWRANLDLESVGLVSRLYKVDNHYASSLDQSLCALNSLLKSREGSRQRETAVTFDRERGKASYLERDLVKKAVVDAHEIDVPACVHDVIGGLYRLRGLELETGQSAQFPLSDGKKSIQARVEAQQRETVRIGGRSHKTVRYEAFLFNNVFYRRRGRLLVWLTDDARKLPVQIKVRLPFYIGTVTLELVKEEKT